MMPHLKDRKERRLWFTKDSAGKEIHEGDSLMDLTPRIRWGKSRKCFLDEDEGELAVNQDGTTI